MSGSNIIIMPSPCKMIVINMQCNTCVRCNSIQSDVTTSGQVYQYQVIAYVKHHVIACQNRQVSGIKIPVSDIKYQLSSIRCQVINMSVSGELNIELQHHMSGHVT